MQLVADQGRRFGMAPTCNALGGARFLRPLPTGPVGAGSSPHPGAR